MNHYYKSHELNIAIEKHQAQWQEAATKKGLEWSDVSGPVASHNFTNNITVELGYDNVHNQSLEAFMGRYYRERNFES